MRTDLFVPLRVFGGVAFGVGFQTQYAGFDAIHAAAKLQRDFILLAQLFFYEAVFDLQLEQGLFELRDSLGFGRRMTCVCHGVIQDSRLPAPSGGLKRGHGRRWTRRVFADAFEPGRRGCEDARMRT